MCEVTDVAAFDWGAAKDRSSDAVGAAQEKATGTPNATKDKGGDYQRTADLTSDQVK